MPPNAPSSAQSVTRHLSAETVRLTYRALTIWPRLDPRALAGCGDDVRQITAVIASETDLPRHAITAMLADAGRAEAQPSFYFG